MVAPASCAGRRRQTPWQGIGRGRVDHERSCFWKHGPGAWEIKRRGGERVTTLSRKQANLKDPDACAAAIKKSAPGAVINAAAFTAVDAAESQADTAQLVNGKAPGAMANACAGLDIPFVHLSTDYVFSGEGERSWQAHDTPAPVNTYRKTKLAGERGVVAAGGRHVVLRTSWVFAAHGQNFVASMLRLSQDRERLGVVSDQVGGPTPAADIADACLSIAAGLAEDGGKAGIYHLSGAPDVSWMDFAQEIFRQKRRKIKLNAIPTSAYPTPAARPLNSRLDCESTRKVFR